MILTNYSHSFILLLNDLMALWLLQVLYGFYFWKQIIPKISIRLSSDSAWGHIEKWILLPEFPNRSLHNNGLFTPDKNYICYNIHYFNRTYVLKNNSSDLSDTEAYAMHIVHENINTGQCRHSDNFGATLVIN